jgi:hypothetical protein
MQREEVALKEGKLSNYSDEIDTQLQLETKAYFAKISQGYIKRWTFIQQNHMRKREELLSLCAQFDVTLTSNQQNDGNNCSSIDLEIESLRLQEIYNKHWHTIEGFHLQEAFRSQRDRINAEWDLHFSQLHEAYEKKVIKLTGESHAMPNSPEGGSAEHNRWHHPEKQKTLIHTAPVLSPVAPKGSAAGSGVRAVRSRAGREPHSAAVTAEVMFALLYFIICY